MQLRIRQATVLDAGSAAPLAGVAEGELAGLIGDGRAYVWVVVDDAHDGAVEGVSWAAAAVQGPTLLELVTFALTEEAWADGVGPALLLHTVGDADCHTRLTGGLLEGLLAAEGFVVEDGLHVRRDED